MFVWGGWVRGVNTYTFVSFVNVIHFYMYIVLKQIIWRILSSEFKKKKEAESILLFFVSHECLGSIPKLQTTIVNRMLLNHWCHYSVGIPCAV